MGSDHAIIAAILIVLVVVVAYQGANWDKTKRNCGPRRRRNNFCGITGCPDREKFGARPGSGKDEVVEAADRLEPFAADRLEPFEPSHSRIPGPVPFVQPQGGNPYDILNRQLDEIRGQPLPGYGRTPFYRQPDGLDRFHRSGANVKPEQIQDAEREQWFAARDETNAPAYNPETIYDQAQQTTDAHASVPAIDYDSYVTDLMVDPRTKENHARWVAEMQPWTGTTMIVDDLDIEPYLNFQGLRRPQAVVQYNPLMLTEADTYDLAPNHKFNFRG